MPLVFISVRRSSWSTSRSAASRRFSGEESGVSPFRNSVSRRFSMTSDSVKTVLPTTTATRSTIAAGDTAAASRVSNTIRGPILKRLSNREEELKVADAGDGRGSAAEEKLLICARQAVVRRWIDAVRQIDGERTDGRVIPNSVADGVHRIVEVGQTFLTKAEGEALQARVDVAEVMEDDTLYVVAEKRKAQLGLMEQQRVAAYGVAGLRIARAGLIVGEGAQGRIAATEEAIG